MKRGSRIAKLGSITAAAGLLVAAVSVPALAVDDAGLTQMITALGETDRAILAKTTQEEVAELMTTRGSANHAVWSAFTERGWMTARPSFQGGPVGLQIDVFAVTPEGRKRIPEILAQARR